MYGRSPSILRVVALVMAGVCLSCAAAEDTNRVPVRLHPGGAAALTVVVGEEAARTNHYPSLTVDAGGFVHLPALHRGVPVAGLTLEETVAMLSLLLSWCSEGAPVAVTLHAGGSTATHTTHAPRDEDFLFIQMEPDAQESMGWLHLGREPPNRVVPVRTPALQGDFWLPGEFERELRRKQNVVEPW